MIGQSIANQSLNQVIARSDRSAAFANVGLSLRFERIWANGSVIAHRVMPPITSSKLATELDTNLIRQPRARLPRSLALCSYLSPLHE